jgi:hypothetical protein
MPAGVPFTDGQPGAIQFIRKTRAGDSGDELQGLVPQGLVPDRPLIGRAVLEQPSTLWPRKDFHSGSTK